VEYTKIDPEAAAQAQLKSQAQSAEAAAYQAECTAEEQAELAKSYHAFSDPAQASAEEAKRLRKEAEAFGSAADIDQATVKAIQEDFLNNWITTIEMNHAGHAASLKVRQGAGLTDQGNEMVMNQLEIAHRIATDRLAKLVGAKAATKKS
jgi:hypothetical protein